ncbi:sterol 3-beta-glucosyltransferase isoform X2 [Drosophila grimshawi]|uniref:sterol 3-beta-glucosyltransferase isoform X2 n=1 Tax=Drosophila grimshawi TaxID=7222 RepID=UPI000C86EF17|nr:sterol 3-beta-glucosyltransferase isoform X2 [Drosophila grimshawi]
MEPFPDISSLILADESTKKQKARFKLQLKKLPKTKSKRVKAEKEQQEQEQQLDKDRELELSEQEVQLLRCNAHEYEELLEHLPHASHASLPRPQSLPGKVQFDAAAVGATLDQPHPLPTIRHGGNTQHIKRESFLRQSLQSIRRSFGSHKHSSKLSIASGVDAGGTLRPTLPSPAGSSNASSSSSSSSTSTTSSTTSSCSSSTAINLLSRAQAHNHILDEFLPTPVVLLLNDDPAHHSDVSDAVYVAKSSLPQSYISYIGPLQSSGSAQDLASSPSSSPKSSQSQGQVKGGNNTAKQHELQQASSVAGISTSTLTSATAAVTGAAIYSIANGVGSVVATPPEKEKKRKEVSSSRVKKFRRHFSQVSNDEHLINYFSCALVGDIPLQGHLYITDQHFAFYSNVFGYVTKVVLPTSSVTRISKEKTAKIIPNAVGVATADERHVFGSFISREAAFRLMCAVCPHLNHGAEILLPKPLAEEYLIDDESSCSISGNESPPQLHDPAAAAAVHEQQALLRQRAGSDRHPEMQSKSLLNDDIDGPINIRSSAPPVVHYKDSMPHHLYQLSSPGAGSRQIFTSALPSVMGSSGASSSSSPITVLGTGVSVAVPTTPINTGNAAGLDAAAAAAANENNAENPPRSRWRIIAASARTHLPMGGPALTELQVLYLGITLAVMLALFSVFLLYRVLDIEAKSSLYNMPVDFNSRGGVDDDIFAEALHWQKKLQEKTTAEAQYILAKNLEQISKVRRSLETLSMLIHDRSTGYAESLPDMNSMPKDAVFASDASD